MRDLIRQIVQNYLSAQLQGQEGGYVLFSGQEPDTHQVVSIKIPSRLLGDDPKTAARFRALAQAMRQLNHTNIVPVRAVGERSGLPYLVTRALEKAQPLAATLDQPWDLDAAVDLGMQVGKALEHAHNKGLFHGSLSPNTVLVQEDGKVQVTDFGASALLDLLGVQLRQAASPFLAPERVAGQPIDARADVYSLGAILYYLLCRREPQVVKGEVLPPGRFNAEVPKALDEVVVKALAPSPADRYPDIRAFLAAFGAVPLAPAAAPAQPAVASARCPKCGTETPVGRFCRRCGARLEQPASRPPAPAAPASSRGPIQVTRVSVGEIKVGKGVELRETVIARPFVVATGDLADLFPKPLEMPKVELAALSASLTGQPSIAMPEPPPMPVIDWASIAPEMPEVPGVEAGRQGS